MSQFGLPEKSPGILKDPPSLKLRRVRAEDEVRTRDLQLGRLSLYQLSYFRKNQM
jgi:hypothetical protein